MPVAFCRHLVDKNSEKCLSRFDTKSAILAFSALMMLVGRQEWWGAGVVICLERGADLHTN